MSGLGRPKGLDEKMAMKIISTVPSNLVERIRQSQEASSSSTAVEGASNPANVEKTDGLVSQIENIALDVVQGLVNDAQQIRRSVIDAIVDDRFGAVVRDSDRSKAVGTLQDVLREDPEFLLQVDNMLVLAAGRLKPAHE
jgi:hypothetical protein